MKLKYWLVILLLLNAAVLAWQWDGLALWGWGPNVHREPERLKQQIRPEALTIAPLNARPSASAAPTDPPAEAPSPSASAPSEPLQRALPALPAASGGPTPVR